MAEAPTPDPPLTVWPDPALSGPVPDAPELVGTPRDTGADETAATLEQAVDTGHRSTVPDREATLAALEQPPDDPKELPDPAPSPDPSPAPQPHPGTPER